MIETWKVLLKNSKSCNIRGFEVLGFGEGAVQNIILVINTVTFLLDLDLHCGLRQLQQSSMVSCKTP